VIEFALGFVIDVTVEHAEDRAIDHATARTMVGVESESQ
jgi:hypothetical protein